MKPPIHVFKWMPVKLVWKNQLVCIYCGLTKEELHDRGLVRDTRQSSEGR